MMNEELERLAQELTRLLHSEAVRTWCGNGSGGHVNGSAESPPPELLEASRVAERLQAFLQAFLREVPTEALHALTVEPQAKERRSRYFG